MLSHLPTLIHVECTEYQTLLVQIAHHAERSHSPSFQLRVARASRLHIAEGDPEEQAGRHHLSG